MRTTDQVKSLGYMNDTSAPYAVIEEVSYGAVTELEVNVYLYLFPTGQSQLSGFVS